MPTRVTVRKGDSFASIARRLGNERGFVELLNFNGGRSLQPGDVIRVPPSLQGATATVKERDFRITAEGIASAQLATARVQGPEAASRLEFLTETLGNLSQGTRDQLERAGLFLPGGLGGVGPTGGLTPGQQAQAQRLGAISDVGQLTGQTAQQVQAQAGLAAQRAAIPPSPRTFGGPQTVRVSPPPAVTPGRGGVQAPGDVSEPTERVSFGIRKPFDIRPRGIVPPETLQAIQTVGELPRQEPGFAEPGIAGVSSRAFFAGGDPREGFARQQAAVAQRALDVVRQPSVQQQTEERERQEAILEADPAAQRAIQLASSLAGRGGPARVRVGGFQPAPEQFKIFPDPTQIARMETAEIVASSIALAVEEAEMFGPPTVSQSLGVGGFSAFSALTSFSRSGGSGARRSSGGGTTRSNRTFVAPAIGLINWRIG